MGALCGSGRRGEERGSVGGPGDLRVAGRRGTRRGWGGCRLAPRAGRGWGVPKTRATEVPTPTSPSSAARSQCSSPRHPSLGFHREFSGRPRPSGSFVLPRPEEWGAGTCAGAPVGVGRIPAGAKTSGSAGCCRPLGLRTYFSQRLAALAPFWSAPALSSPGCKPRTRIKLGTRRSECLLVLVPQRPLARIPIRGGRSSFEPPIAATTWDPGPSYPLGLEQTVLKAPPWRTLNSQTPSVSPLTAGRVSALETHGPCYFGVQPRLSREAE